MIQQGLVQRVADEPTDREIDLRFPQKRRSRTMPSRMHNFSRLLKKSTRRNSFPSVWAAAVSVVLVEARYGCPMPPLVVM
ncbi:MAG: hypothetical protein ACK4S2_12770, partial [Gemmobacter sp.]|uniref:hypothetical protein n=1 Tax=Gemmobacter sp. TaxID=1898957 RepID=UPI00391AAD9D